MSEKNLRFLTPASVGAVFGFLAVLAGAFGAHALKEGLIERGTLATWETAVVFHLLHAVAIASLGWATGTSRWRSRAGLVAAGWTLGTLLFSGSLYLLAVGGPGIFGPITPIGGLFLLMAWALAAFFGTRLKVGVD
jgi:uncharacterized membrane protein YgdD (TMEM256/DUF423 family)